MIPGSQGGKTDPDNLATLCWFRHHVVVHQHGYRIDPATPADRRRILLQRRRLVGGGGPKGRRGFLPPGHDPPRNAQAFGRYDPYYVAVIPFYGIIEPEMFAIERRAMDRPGLVIEALARRLPASGRVLDIGAGDGHTAMRLQTPLRRIVALEPARQMMRRDRPLAWVQGDAEHVPFSPGSFDAAYATWAYFFSRDWDPSPGIRELHRVVRTGGPLLIVDNLGDDEFTGLASSDITADPGYWRRQGFECEAIDSRFEFDDLQEAAKLLGFYFGDLGRTGAMAALSYRVGLFHSVSTGSV